MASPLLFFVLTGAYPVAFLVSNNWFVYDTKQLLFLLIIPAITLFLGSLIIFVSTKLRFFKKNDAIRNIILGLIGFLILFLFLKFTITKSAQTITMFLLLASVAFVAIKIRGFRFINFMLLAITMISIGELTYSAVAKSNEKTALLASLNKSSDQEIKFENTPNIYLLHLESYHSVYAMKELYHFDNDEFSIALKNYGFFVNENNFANYLNTLSSVSSTFLQQHHYYKLATGNADAAGLRGIVGGRAYNPTLSILKNNGYQIKFIHDTAYSFASSDQLDYFYPATRTDQALSIFQSKTIDTIHNFLLEGFSKHNDDSKDESYYKALWRQIDHKPQKPTFTYIKEPLAISHTPPDGSYSWTDRDRGWDEQYIASVKASNDKILESIERIIKNDPEAIIMLSGDHGAWKYRDIWRDTEGKDVNKLIFERAELGAKDLALDLFGVFSAIRYPDHSCEILDGETNINIFRKLFAELSPNENLTQNKPANNAYIDLGSKLYLLVKDGKPLDQIEIVDKPPK